MIPRDALLVLTGPTASGKKDVGFEIARHLRAEVLALDSVKAYRGLAIGGAQPLPAESEGIALHLVAVADPHEAFSTGRWAALAAKAAQEVRARGALPLFVGGTPLYLRALLRGLVTAPGPDPQLRAELEAVARARGVPALHAELSTIDPAAAAWIGRNDLKRIVRAIEVHRLTGIPMSRLQRERTRRPIEGEPRVVGLACAEALLRERQRRRVDAMFERGLVAEVAKLEADGMLKGEAARAIGYRQVLAHLRGECSRDETLEQIVRDTWELTRKQRKWFRQFPEILWVERRADSTTADLAAEAIARFES